MKNYQRLKGLIAASFTPMDAQGKINLSVIDKYADLMAKSDMTGVFVCGTTGESQSLTTHERKNILEQWVKSSNGRFKVIAHVGSNSQVEAIELARHAAETGADAIAAMAPCFFKPETVKDLIDFFTPIANSAEELPFYYYNMPSMTGVFLPVATFLTEGKKVMPNLVGTKFTHNNLMEMGECLTLNNGEFEVLHGYDEILISGLAFGAVAGVGSTYNYLPEVYHGILKAVEEGDFQHARKLQMKSIEIGKTDRNKALIEMQEKYDQQKIINENNLSQIKKDRIIRNVLIALIILSFIIAITNYLYQRKIVSQKQEISEKEEKIRYFTMKIHENETLINRNKMRIEELTIQMEGSLEIKEQWKEQNKIRQEIQQQNETLKLENNNLQNHISNYAQSLKEKSKELEAMEHLSKENQYLHKREAFLCNQLIKQTELFNKLKTTKYIDNKLWQEIKEKIDLLFDNYTKRLCHQIPSLTDGDIQICCLIKLRFSNGDIANMLAISPTSVSKRKLRLKERIVQEIGSLGENQSLDLWLMEY